MTGRLPPSQVYRMKPPASVERTADERDRQEGTLGAGGREPESRGPVLVQLIEWFLRNHKPLVPNDLEDMLQLVERVKLSWAPLQAMQYLVQGVFDPNERLLPSDEELEKAEPTELATLLTFALREQDDGDRPGLSDEGFGGMPFLAR